MHGVELGPDELTTEEAIDLVKQMAELGVKEVTLIGGEAYLRDLKLTTAASIWIVAATGVATGAGLWRAATISIVLTLAVLTIGHSVDNALHRVSGPDRD